MTALSVATIRPRGRLLVAVAVGTAVAAAALRAADHDIASDAAAGVARASSAVSGLGATVFVCLAAVSVLHYAAAAVATRAAGGRWIPWRDLIAAQYAAAAANRLTPAGIGGTALIGRFLARRGRLTAADAAASVSVLTLLGGLSDVVALGLLVALAFAIRAPGASAHLTALTARVTGLVPVPSAPVACALVAAALAATGLVLGRRDRTRRVAHAVRGYGRSLAGVARQPMRLLALTSASAATTLVLAAGFAATAVLPTTGVGAGQFVPLMIAYMVASAASGALPLPGGVGATEAAFAAVFVSAGETSTLAVASAVIFRVVTFWLPPVYGLLALRRLRSNGAL